MYTRDEFSTNNANGVLPASNIRWIRGELSGCTQHGAHIGDFFQSTPTRTQINSEDVQILGAKLILNGMRAVIITLGDRVVVKGCVMGGNGGGNNISFDNFGSRVGMLDVADNYPYGSAVGAETGVYVLSAGAVTLNASHGGKVYRTANTGATIIAAFSGGRAGQELTLHIDDDFTTCTVGGVSVKGKGTCAEYYNDAATGAWVCKHAIPVQEATTGWSATPNVDFSNPGITSRFMALGSTTTSLNVTLPATSLAGRRYTLRLTPGNAGNKGITAWGAGFRFTTAAPAPAVVNDGTSTVIDFYWSGTLMVALNVGIYAN